MTTQKLRKTINGQRMKKVAGYAVWYNRSEQRRERCVSAWVSIETECDDCGSGTDSVVAALLAAARKLTTRDVKVRECWEC